MVYIIELQSYKVERIKISNTQCLFSLVIMSIFALIKNKFPGEGVNLYPGVYPTCFGKAVYLSLFFKEIMA